METKNQIMKEFKNKKIAIKLILFSVFGILISYQLKIPKSNLFSVWKLFKIRNITVPNNYYCIDFFGFEVSYNFIFIFLLITLGVGIYMALFKSDQQLRLIFKVNCVDSRLFIGKFFKNIYKDKFREIMNKRKTIVVTSIGVISIFDICS